MSKENINNLTNTKTTTQDKFSSAEGSPCRLVPSFEQTISSLDPTPNCTSHLEQYNNVNYLKQPNSHDPGLRNEEFKLWSMTHNKNLNNSPKIKLDHCISTK